MADAPGSDGGGKPVWLDFLSTFADLLKAILWPAIVGIFLWVNSEPLGALVRQLPEKFSQASKIGFAGLSVEIEQQANEAGNPELARRLNGLSPDAVKLLIEIGDSLHQFLGTSADAQDASYFLPTDEKMADIIELERAGLLEFDEEYDRYMSWLQNGPFEFQPRDQFGDRLVTPTRALTAEESERIVAQGYRLTALGKDAWNLVLDVIFNQLNAAGDGDTD